MWPNIRSTKHSHNCANHVVGWMASSLSSFSPRLTQPAVIHEDMYMYALLLIQNSIYSPARPNFPMWAL